uniref:Nuclear receptor domain-containing protein n=1 Tax=Macrostomum lignano TaxID=282301 RepID=A0A1I8F7F7_9PLAT
MQSVMHTAAQQPSGAVAQLPAVPMAMLKPESSLLTATCRPLEECQVCGTGANVRKNFGVPSCVSCRISYSRNTGKAPWENSKQQQRGRQFQARASSSPTQFEEAASASPPQTQVGCRRPHRGSIEPRALGLISQSELDGDERRARLWTGAVCATVDKLVSRHASACPFDCPPGELACGHAERLNLLAGRHQRTTVDHPVPVPFFEAASTGSSRVGHAVSVRAARIQALTFCGTALQGRFLGHR